LAALDAMRARFDVMLAVELAEALDVDVDGG
jgi:hypothetical protein